MRDLSVEKGAAQRTYAGDWATVSDRTRRRQALLRRLVTPQGALWYDREYGNPAYGRLSQPVTEGWLRQVSADCRWAAEQERGVTVLGVVVERQDRKTVVALQVDWGDGTPEQIRAIL